MLSVLQPAKFPCSLVTHDVSMDSLRHNDVGSSTRLSLHRIDSFASEDSTSSNFDHDYGSKPPHIFTSSQGEPFYFRGSFDQRRVAHRLTMNRAQPTQVRISCLDH